MFSKKLLTQKLQINQFPYLKKDSEKKLPYLYKKKIFLKILYLKQLFVVKTYKLLLLYVLYDYYQECFLFIKLLFKNDLPLSRPCYKLIKKALIKKYFHKKIPKEIPKICIIVNILIFQVF